MVIVMRRDLSPGKGELRECVNISSTNPILPMFSYSFHRYTGCRGFSLRVFSPVFELKTKAAFFWC